MTFLALEGFFLMDFFMASQHITTCKIFITQTTREWTVARMNSLNMSFQIMQAREHFITLHDHNNDQAWLVLPNRSTQQELVLSSSFSSSSMN